MLRAIIILLGDMFMNLNPKTLTSLLLILSFWSLSVLPALSSNEKKKYIGPGPVEKYQAALKIMREAANCKNPNEAISKYLEAASLYRYDPDIYENIGFKYRKLREYELAKQYFLIAKFYKEKYYDKNDTSLLHLYWTIARMCKVLGEYDEAENYYDKVADGVSSYHSPYLVKALLEYSHFLGTRRKERKAGEILQRYENFKMNTEILPPIY